MNARTFARFAAILIALNLTLAVVLWAAARSGFVANREREIGVSPAVVQHVAELIANAAFRSVITADYAALNSVIDQTAGWADLVYVSVEDSQGRVLAHTDSSRVGQLWTDRMATEIRRTVKVPYDDVVVPIIEPGSDTKGRPIGRVRLAHVVEPEDGGSVPAGWLLWDLMVLGALISVPMTLTIMWLNSRIGRAAERADRHRLHAALNELVVVRDESDRLARVLTERTAELARAQKQPAAQIRAVHARELEAARAHADAIRSATRMLRSPLTNVLGFSKLLLRGSDGGLNEAQTTDLQNIHAAGLHLLEGVEVLSDLGRAVMRTIDIAPQALDANAVLQEVADTAGAVQATRVRIDAPLDLPPIEADPQHVTQILRALILEGRPPGTDVEITVSGSATDETVRLEMLVPPPDDSVASIAGDRRSLRLQLATSLAAINGGALTVENRPDAGVLFVLTFPRADTVNSRAQHQEPETAQR